MFLPCAGSVVSMGTFPSLVILSQLNKWAASLPPLPWWRGLSALVKGQEGTMSWSVPPAFLELGMARLPEGTPLKSPIPYIQSPG